MADFLDVSLTAVDRHIWRGNARMVVAKTPEGEIGILPGHQPVLSILVDGLFRIETETGEKLLGAAHGGFFSVNKNEVKILAETAELSSEIDVERVQLALDRIMEDGVIDDAEKDAESRARVRLKAVMGGGR
jgi:F-type H+-transporting ATPase subunit epsilon